MKPPRNRFAALPLAAVFIAGAGSLQADEVYVTGTLQIKGSNTVATCHAVNGWSEPVEIRVHLYVGEDVFSTSPSLTPPFENRGIQASGIGEVRCIVTAKGGQPHSTVANVHIEPNDKNTSLSLDAKLVPHAHPPAQP